MIKFLHTADWHIGQTFHEHDRTYEHQQFLNWLVNTIREQEIDVILISGDVFDLSNPAAASVRMFYTFLNHASKINPGIQIIITAGNHDSAIRLESPKPLLEAYNIHIIGLTERNEDGSINYKKLIIPIKDKHGEIKLWCLAIPFLRTGDYPALPDCNNPYPEGVAALYKQAYEQALSVKQQYQAIIAMGHLHTLNAEITGDDSVERLIMGGVEFIPVTTFHDEIRYVALGHIHKAQRIGGKEHIRYSGSPIPMSFSELNYRHQVIVFEMENGDISNLQSIEVPVSVSLLKVPATHKPLHEVLSTLLQLPDGDADSKLPPYLEVSVLLDGPEPALRHKVETALAGKYARLVKIDVKYPASPGTDYKTDLISHDKLHDLKPLDVFIRIYQKKYNTPLPGEMLQLFNQVVQEINQQEYHT